MSGLTRRTLLERSAIGLAAVGVGAAWPGLGCAGEGEEPSGYVPGFNDAFGVAAIGGIPSLPGPSTAYEEAVLGSAAGTGARFVRTNVRWADVQGEGPTAWDWSRYEPLILLASKMGLKVLPILIGSPPWARPGSQDPPGTPIEEALYPDNLTPPDPQYLGSYAQFAVATLATFGDLADGVELGNEPNLSGTLPGQRILAENPILFADLVAVTGAVVQRAFGNRKSVVAGGLFAKQGDSWATYMETYLNRLAETFGSRGLPENLAVGFHAYDFSHDPGRMRRNIVALADRAHRIITDAVGERPFWLTETGAPSDPGRIDGGEAAQRDVLVGLASDFAARAWCRAFVIHRLVDDPITEPASSPYYSFGVCEDTNPFDPKPAYYGLKESWGGEP